MKNFRLFRESIYKKYDQFTQSGGEAIHQANERGRRAFKRRELEAELAHEDDPGSYRPRPKTTHPDENKPHDVHINGRKWKAFPSRSHAKNVAKSLRRKGTNAEVKDSAGHNVDLYEQVAEEKHGLWYNIRKKRNRIKHGSGEHMRKPGSKGAPTAAALKASQNEEVEQIDEAKPKGPFANPKVRKKLTTGPFANPEVRNKWQKTPGVTSSFVTKRAAAMRKPPFPVKEEVKQIVESKLADKITKHPAVEYYGGKEDHHFINLKPGYIHDSLQQHSFANNNAREAASELKHVVKCDCDSCKHTVKEEVEQIDEASSHVAYLKPKTGTPHEDHFEVPVDSDDHKAAHRKFTQIMGHSIAKNYEVVHVKPREVKEEVEQINERGADSKGYKRSTESGAGLTAKGAKHFGVKTAVTTPPSKLNPKGKAAKRRKSFCARMSGMKGPMKDEKGRPTRKAMSLRRWHCR